MFKQELDVRSSAPLSSADKKKVKAAVKKFLTSTGRPLLPSLPATMAFEERVRVKEVGAGGEEVAFVSYSVVDGAVVKHSAASMEAGADTALDMLFGKNEIIATRLRDRSFLYSLKSGVCMADSTSTSSGGGKEEGEEEEGEDEESRGGKGKKGKKGKGGKEKKAGGGGSGGSGGKNTVTFPTPIPLLLDYGGRGQKYLFTTYFLAALPLAHPCLVVPPPVSQYLFNGADLMAPAIDYDTCPRFRRGDILSVGVYGNPFPIAVGEALVDIEDVEKVKKGKVLEIHHHFGDVVCSNAKREPLVDLPGFSGIAVYPILKSRDGVEVEVGGEVDDWEARIGDESEEGKEEKESEDAEKVGEVLSSMSMKAKGSHDGEEGESDEEEEGEGGEGRMSLEDYDTLLLHTFVDVMVHLKKKGELPVSPSTLSSEMKMWDSRAQLKCTSFKKMTKFLSHLQKNGMIGVKAGRGGVIEYVTSADERHEMLEGYKPKKTPPAPTSSSEGGERAEGGRADGGATRVRIVWRHKLGKKVRFLLQHGEVGDEKGTDGVTVLQSASGDPVLHTGQARALLDNYIEEEMLNDIDEPSHALIDAALCDALWDGPPYPEREHKANIAKRLQKRLVNVHALITVPLSSPKNMEVEVASSKFKQGDIPHITVQVKKMPAGKMMTVVSGLENYGLDSRDFVPVFKKKFAASVTLHENKEKGKKVQRAVHVQGRLTTAKRGRKAPCFYPLLIGG